MGISTPARDWLFIELLETTGAIEWSFNMKSFGNGSSVVAPRLDLNPLPPEDLDEVETGVKDLKKKVKLKKKSQFLTSNYIQEDTQHYETDCKMKLHLDPYKMQHNYQIQQTNQVLACIHQETVERHVVVEYKQDVVGSE